MVEDIMANGEWWDCLRRGRMEERRLVSGNELGGVLVLIGKFELYAQVLGSVQVLQMRW